MQFPHQLFKDAGLNPTDVANLCEVSRITGYRWLRGVNRQGRAVGVNIFLRSRVRRLVGPLQAALDDGALPNEAIKKLPPKARATKLKAILKLYRQEK